MDGSDSESLKKTLNTVYDYKLLICLFLVRQQGALEKTMYLKIQRLGLATNIHKQYSVNFESQKSPMSYNSIYLKSLSSLELGTFRSNVPPCFPLCKYFVFFKGFLDLFPPCKGFSRAKKVEENCCY